MKLDKFTWIVIGVVVALVVAAVVTVNMAGNQAPEATYMTEDTPAAPVYNAFLALQQGNTAKARTYYSARVLDEIDQQVGYSPFSSYASGQARRLRITDVSTNAAEPDRAYVSFTLDSYSNSGPFGAGAGYSYERTVEVIREDDAWKLDAQEFFY